MTMSPQLQDLTPTDAVSADTPKRREIIDGARQVFRSEGFDGASMGQIAQAAGVSKGTLYVYFQSKEDLFHALVVNDRREAAEHLFQLDERAGRLETREMLRELGESFITMMVRPEHIALVRMVMGAAEKLPHVGRAFYETGPCLGIRRVSEYLAREVEAGRLEIDCELDLAAGHFLNLCQGNLIKPQFFCSEKPPSKEEIAATVESAVTVFLRAFGPGSKSA